MNYKIIQDEDKFRDFVDWLPDLADGEKIYYTLFARKKYSDVVKSDKAQLGRGVSNKEMFFDKVKKLEVELGSYKLGGVEVPQEALALYVSPNPRSTKKASLTTAKMILDNIGKDRYQNPKSIAMNALQKSKSRTVFVDFDIDYKESGYGSQLMEWVYDKVGYSAKVGFIETRGGFHVLIEPETVEEQYKKTWYQDMCKHPSIDQKGDLLLPVVGCVQGDFVPRLL